MLLFSVLHGVRGELYPKACLVSLQWTKFTYSTNLRGHLYSTIIGATLPPELVTYTKTFISYSSSRPSSLKTYKGWPTVSCHMTLPKSIHSNLMTNELHPMQSTINLPTISDIEASTDVLSIRTNAIKVVRVKERLTVKIGYAIPPLEAENMKYVAANSKVAVPKVYANFVDPETQKRYIIMDFIPGTDLQKLLPSLTPAEKTTVSERIKETLNELRTIPPPGYFGNLNGTPYIDGVLSTPDNNPIISGPFKDQEELNQGILERLGQRHSPHYIRLLREMVNRTFKNHRTVFTHGDLQPKNIMVERREIHDDGGADFKVALIDWNLSGW